MVKFIKPNKAVVVLQGRHAGHKAAILRNFDDGTCDRPYGHCLVAGVAKYPAKVVRRDSASHIMPTRYTLDVDLKDVVSPDALASRGRKVAGVQGDQGAVGGAVQVREEPLVFLEAPVLRV
ncbi:60S ribosomal protein L27 [Striga asiatica]|uniref:60S ribosomal protein L27 n=1 Tax=Striga asiatica TaxID=4170 RepID=A0A5A7QRW1_STRAF|nr:60S ribosomal protein L27 [Striga asiatica]